MARRSSGSKGLGIWPWIGLALVIVIIDQFTKTLILGYYQYGDATYVAPFFNVVRAHNTGAAFSFLASPSSAKTYTFGVRQTYSDGSVVDWNGPESSDTPSPTIDVKTSFGGGGSSTLAIVALVVGAIGIVLGGLALFSGGRRSLA